MKKIIVYSSLLLAGLVLSQLLPRAWPEAWASMHMPLELLTMACLAFIMIQVGYEFEIDKSKAVHFARDFMIASTAAVFPWIFCALYFIWAMGSDPKPAATIGLFSAPTSAGILFSMLAAAGLAKTWVFQKARILAVFDDVATLLLLVPLKFILVGMSWALLQQVFLLVVLLTVGWIFIGKLRWHTQWGWTLFYAVVVTAICRGIHFEVLLPAFILGVLIDAEHDHLSSPAEERATTLITSLFLILVGLSMPNVFAATASEQSEFSWRLIAIHVAVITVLANIGKMFCLFCYRTETSFRNRLAVSIAMWPRGEVGAGILTISLSYGFGGPAMTVAILSLTLNLLFTGLFIAMVKRLIADETPKPSTVTA